MISKWQSVFIIFGCAFHFHRSKFWQLSQFVSAEKVDVTFIDTNAIEDNSMIWNRELPFYPASVDGSCIFISNAASKIGRELVFYFADLGIHVLAGVKSAAEMKYFMFQSPKGLELIIFDMNDPATLATVVYRIKEISWDLGRTFLGVILDTIGRSI